MSDLIYDTADSKSHESKKIIHQIESVIDDSVNQILDTLKQGEPEGKLSAEHMVQIKKQIEGLEEQIEGVMQKLPAKMQEGIMNMVNESIAMMQEGVSGELDDVRGLILVTSGVLSENINNVMHPEYKEKYPQVQLGNALQELNEVGMDKPVHNLQKLADIEGLAGKNDEEREKAFVKKVEHDLAKSLAELKSGKYGNYIREYIRAQRAANVKIYNDTNNQQPKIAVKGLGPTGLVLAIKSFINGARDIYAVENRDSYTRNQTFRFPANPDGRDWLKHLFKEIAGIDLRHLPKDHPLQKIMDSGAIRIRATEEKLQKGFGEGQGLDLEHWEIATKNLEKILFAVLEIAQSVDKESLHIYRGKNKRYSLVIGDPEDNGPGTINIVKNFNPRAAVQEGASAPQGTLVKTVGVDIAYACDGASSATRGLAHEVGIKNEVTSSKGDYIALNMYQNNGQAGTKPFTGLINPKDKRVINNNKEQRKKNLERLKQLGWQEKYLGSKSDWPALRTFFTTDAYVGAQVPSGVTNILLGLQNAQRKCKAELDKAKDRVKQVKLDANSEGSLAKLKIAEAELKKIQSKYDDATKAYEDTFIEIAKLLLSEVATEEELQQLSFRSGTFFPVELTVTQDQCAEDQYVTNGVVVVFTGDVGSTAHFQTGSGSLIGIESARYAAKIVKMVTSQMQDYDQNLTAKELLSMSKDYFRAVGRYLAYKLQKKVEYHYDISTIPFDNLDTLTKPIPLKEIWDNIINEYNEKTSIEGEYGNDSIPEGRLINMVNAMEGAMGEIVDQFYGMMDILQKGEQPEGVQENLEQFHNQTIAFKKQIEGFIDRNKNMPYIEQIEGMVDILEQVEGKMQEYKSAIKKAPQKGKFLNTKGMSSNLILTQKDMKRKIQQSFQQIKQIEKRVKSKAKL